MLRPRASGIMSYLGGAIEEFRNPVPERTDPRTMIPMGQSMGPVPPMMPTAQRMTSMNAPQATTPQAPFRAGVGTIRKSPTMGLGQGVRMTPEQLAEQAAKAVKIEQERPEIAAEPGFMKTVTDFFGDRENMLRLAAGFNTMRLQPDQGLAQMISTELKDISTQRRIKETGTATAAILRKTDPQLAQLLEQGVIDAKTALTLSRKNPTQLQQMMKLFEDDPETFQRMAQMGAFGGDVDLGQGDYLKALAGSFGKKIEGYDERATNARNLLNGLQEVSRLLEVTDTGKFAETKLAWTETLQKFGFDVDSAGISDMQALRAATNRLVAEELRKNKGPQTDFDAEFTGRFLPGLGQTNEANQQILKYLASTQRLELVLGNMAYDSLTGTFEQDRKNIGAIDKIKRAAPAVIPNQQGGYVHFATFYENARKKGKADREIMDAWVGLAGGL